MSDTGLRTAPNQLGLRPPVRPRTLPNFRTPAVAGELGRLANYRIVKALGSGGMGAVFLALDETLNRRVALKVMLPEAAADPACRERFLREARAAAAVHHDNVVTIYQVGEDGGMPFIAMELLSGYPLDEYLDRHGRLTMAQLLRVGQETAAGLTAAHALGLIHRDIKPANLWLEAPRGRIKLLDFGLAKAAGADAASLTTTGEVVGTPAYMSPEQARGWPLDERSDLFSLGIVLYLLATGQMPFEGDTPTAVLTALAVDEPIPVRAHNPTVPEPLAELIHRLLAKNPKDRPRTAQDVAEQLRSLGTKKSPPAEPAAPQVVYVPVQVSPAPAPPSAKEEPFGSAFACLESSPEPSRSTASHIEPKRAGRGIWIAALAAMLLAVGLLAGTVYALRKPAAPKESPAIEPKAAPPAAKPTAKQNPPPTDPNPTGGVRPGDFAAAQQFNQVMSRYLGMQPISPAELELIQNTRLLATTEIGPTPIDDSGFEKLTRFQWVPELLELQITPLKLSDAGFTHFSRFQNLRRLCLHDIPINEDRLKALAGLPRLTVLCLGGCKLTEKAAGQLPALRSVTALDLAGATVDDDALQMLATMPALTSLNLQRTTVTDAGLEHLQGCKQLAVLNLKGTQVTPEGVKRLREAIPACLVLADEKP